MAAQLKDAQGINWNSMVNLINVLELNNMSDIALQQYQVNDSELGKKTNYDSHYNPDKLFAIPRAGKRKEIGINPDALPFYGFDCWNHYEVSWLNPKGKPVVAIAQIIYDCATPNIIESKSLKLYFNSFNNTKFKDSDAVKNTVITDLEKHLGGSVQVELCSMNDSRFSTVLPCFAGICLDDLEVECHEYLVNPLILTTSEERVDEVVYSDLLKSNCLVTNQPDWGSVQIAYQGAQIDHGNLLKYIVSFRNHNEFHEQCIERIFADIMQYCKPEKLTVYGRYTRRGGLDINPYRSTEKVDFDGKNVRLVRQ